MNREQEIRQCVKEIEEICNKYRVSLIVHDYDEEVSWSISNTALMLKDNDAKKFTGWDYDVYK